MAGRRQIGGNVNPYVNAEQWPPPCDLLIVGGGGPGSFAPFSGINNNIGNPGGGGGEVVFLQNFIPPLGTSMVDVGSGGWGNGGSAPMDTNTPGASSRIFGITAQGGTWRNGVAASVGHWGHYIPQFDGYGTDASNSAAPAAATGGYGWFGGGGGGTGSPGASNPSYTGGRGGGAAAGDNAGGGGAAGTHSTGGGGGAGSVAGNSSGSGGSGIIVLRYPDVYPNVSNIVGLFSTKSYGGYKYYAFFAGGSVDTITF